MTEHLFISPHPRDSPAHTRSPSNRTTTCSRQSCCSLQPTAPLQTCQQRSFPASFSFSIMQVFCLASSHLFFFPFLFPLVNDLSACRPALLLSCPVFLLQKSSPASTQPTSPPGFVLFTPAATRCEPQRGASLPKNEGWEPITSRTEEGSV